jgi:hypothetical protein
VRITVTGKIMSVATMVAENKIIQAEQRAQRYGDIFLPEARMRRAIDSALLEQLEQLPLETADQEPEPQILDGEFREAATGCAQFWGFRFRPHACHDCPAI